MSDDARVSDEDLERLEKLCAENTPDADVTFDPEDAECTRCGTSMSLNEMAEWEDDPRGNVCNDCAAVFYPCFYDQVPRLLAEVRASRGHGEPTDPRVMAVAQAIYCAATDKDPPDWALLVVRDPGSASDFTKQARAAIRALRKP